MAVTGFDTSLPKGDIKNALMKHLSVYDALVHNNRTGGSGLHSEAFVYMHGEKAIEKALELSGRDVGGWNIVVTEVAPARKNVPCGYTPRQSPESILLKKKNKTMESRKLSLRRRQKLFVDMNL